MKRMLVVPALAVLALALAHVAGAEGTSTIRGVVWEKDAGTVAGATVTVIHQSTALIRKTTTDDEGRFALPALPHGDYSIRTHRQGLKTDWVPDVPLMAGQVLDFYPLLTHGEIEHVYVDWTMRTAPPPTANQKDGDEAEAKTEQQAKPEE